ncbi:hypothetical protein ACGF12_22590 [Kitasatospora sp. NPDC048296]|uniref:hypothetical protein n=1 Tax=Kitasatospora sp. NPDC048296 TaxID=3364048 RepID=UPI003722E08C
MSLADATRYILTDATEGDLDRMITAIRDRRDALAKIRAAAVTTGSTVTTRNLKPKYLIGLSGTVAAIDGNRADLDLDEASTDSLRWARQTRFPVPANAKSSGCTAFR